MKRHRPPHLYLDDTFYTITGSILYGHAFLRPNWARDLLLQKRNSFPNTIFAVMPG